jgi:PmbA protein
MCDLAKGEAEQFDIIASNSHSEGLSIFQGQVQNTEISDSVGLGLRVIKDGRPGYAHTERLTKEAIAQTIKDAVCHTQWTEKVDFELPSPATIPAGEPNYNAALESLSLAELKDFCIELEKQTFARSVDIKNIPYLGADLSRDFSIVANHKGLFYTDRENSVAVGAGAVAVRDGVSKLGNFVKNGRDWDEFSVSEIADRAATYATELFGAKKIEGGKIPVVLSERISGRFMRMYSQPYLADSMQKGLSRLSGKEGSKIASDCLSLWSVGSGDLFSHHFPYDSEGVPTQLVKVIDGGVFGQGLYNLETAAKAGCKSTGNGVRDLGTKMSTSFYNMYVPCGEKSTEELLKLFPSCLLVARLEGNSGCNSVSGELSIGAHGFWCENGQIVHPVDSVTLSGNYFDIIQEVVACGNAYYDDFSSTKVPALAVQSLSVSN